jgi:hypothetical protein
MKLQIWFSIATVVAPPWASAAASGWEAVLYYDVDEALVPYVSRFD